MWSLGRLLKTFGGLSEAANVRLTQVMSSREGKTPWVITELRNCCCVSSVSMQRHWGIWIKMFRTNAEQEATKCETMFNLLYPGGRLNKKDGLTRYGDSHVKDKTS